MPRGFGFERAVLAREGYHGCYTIAQDVPNGLTAEEVELPSDLNQAEELGRPTAACVRDAIIQHWPHAADP